MPRARPIAGAIISQAEIENLRISLGLDQPWYVQYWRWFTNIVLHNNWGMSWEWKRPVGEVIWERMPLTLGIAFSTLFFMYAVSIPVGIYSAVRRYSVGDHVVSIIGYLGLATPNFLLALVLMYLSQKYFGQSVGGLFSPQFQNAPWSWARVDGPAGASGRAGGRAWHGRHRVPDPRHARRGARRARQDVRAVGQGERPVADEAADPLPVRMALNPIASTLGWRLTYVISGAPIVGFVLALPDTGPLFLTSLLNQDMQLAGALIFIYCALTIIGTLVSDLLLVALDPRIRLE